MFEFKEDWSNVYQVYNTWLSENPWDAMVVVTDAVRPDKHRWKFAEVYYRNGQHAFTVERDCVAEIHDRKLIDVLSLGEDVIFGTPPEVANYDEVPPSWYASLDPHDDIIAPRWVIEKDGPGERFRRERWTASIVLSGIGIRTYRGICGRYIIARPDIIAEARVIIQAARQVATKYEDVHIRWSYKDYNFARPAATTPGKNTQLTLYVSTEIGYAGKTHRFFPEDCNVGY